MNRLINPKNLLTLSISELDELLEEGEAWCDCLVAARRCVRDGQDELHRLPRLADAVKRLEQLRKKTK